MCNKITEILSVEKVEKALKGYYGVPNHSTQVVIVKKQETSEEDKLLKKSIKDDYKRTFKHLLIVRDDQIKEKTFSNSMRGFTISAVEFRTLLPTKKYEIVCEVLQPLMSFSNDAYLKKIKTK